MKIGTQPREDCQLAVQVEVEPERFAVALKRAARALSERVKIPGFRPGKAPYAMIAQHVGEDVIREEALDSLVDEVYPAVLKELDLRPSYPGALTNVEEGEPLRLTFVIPLPPQVSLGDYRSVRVPYEWEPPSEEAVDSFLKASQIQKGEPRVVTEDRPVQADDLVILKITLRHANARPEDPPLLERTPVVVVREDNQSPDEVPFPGFSTQLIGLRKGERKTIFYHYPDDAQEDMVRDQDIVHEVEVQEIVVIDLPELNDEFAKTISPFETMEALRENVAEFLRNRSRVKYESQYSVQVVDEIRKGAKVIYPPQMLEEWIEKWLENFKSALEKDGQDLDTYLKSKEMTLEEFKEKEIRPHAQVVLERELIMDKVGEEEQVEVAEKDVEAILNSVVHEWFEEQQRSAGKKRAKPSAKETEAMLFFSVEQARRKAVRDRLVAIGRGEAPELAEKSKPANAPVEESALGGKATAQSAAASTSHAS